jgi:hypothetical protein
MYLLLRPIRSQDTYVATPVEESSSTLPRLGEAETTKVRAASGSSESEPGSAISTPLLPTTALATTAWPAPSSGAPEPRKEGLVAAPHMSSGSPSPKRHTSGPWAPAGATSLSPLLSRWLLPSSRSKVEPEEPRLGTKEVPKESSKE